MTKEAEISAFTRGSATVRYSSITLKREEEGRRTKELLSYFKTLTSSSRGAEWGVHGSQLTSSIPPSVSQVITEREMRASRGETFSRSSSLPRRSQLPSFFFLIREGEKEARDSDEGGGGGDRKRGRGCFPRRRLCVCACATRTLM